MYFGLIKGFCRNCEEERDIGIMNGQHPEFPILCSKCGFKSVHRFPEDFFRPIKGKNKQQDNKGE